ncbi:T9SS type A sorting domain-containing protein [Dyadobacter chenhuakuii]|uniref:T9SS type A sorting domain-containing protein n=1 Tax=Dyadobacter chenhuakuii TaxID=2909339 RepID=A0A9X1QEM8_9BACT|nr:T9SS type A sorting domain-containing protein [Dyadobacter chenhuakuii]MCF2499936.1 T9SS type A sorting domain-containing protein [Dyadobacter chenhuakuii]
MKKHYLIFFICLSTVTSFAQWVDDPKVNNTIHVPLASDYINQHHLMEDGLGGAVFVWDTKSDDASQSKSLGQKVDANGVLKFPPAGQYYGLGDIVNAIRDPKTNGTFICRRSSAHPGSSNFYIQLNDAAGNLVWQADIGTVSYSGQPVFHHQVISDGLGGAFIVWRKYINTSFWSEMSDLYIQRVNSAGVVQWQEGSVPLCTAEGIQDRMQIATDNMGNAIITWVDLRTPYNRNIYAQKINAAGEIQWQKDGILVCGATGHQINPSLISNGEGGAIIAWEDSRGARTNTYIQSVNGDGSMKWAVNGIRVIDDVSIQTSPRLVSDERNGAILTWQDNRKNEYNVYVQRINGDGQMMWETAGKVACIAPGYKEPPKIVKDGSGGAILVWGDWRISENTNIFAQLIDGDGHVKWTLNGAEVATNESFQAGPQIISDMKGGAIISWIEGRDTDDGLKYLLQASRIKNDGKLPVTLTYFAVNKQDGGNLLTWETSQETNSESFSIERGADGKTFEIIGTVQAIGTSNQNKSYRFLDVNPNPGNNYYRLKQTDLDGKFAHSKMINVRYDSVGDDLTVSPSPGTGLFIVHLKSINTGTIKVVSSNGKEMYRKEFNNQNEILIDIQNVQAGSYVLQVVSEGIISSKKILKF